MHNRKYRIVQSKNTKKDINTETLTKLYQYRPLGLGVDVEGLTSGICGKELNTSATLFEYT